MLKLGQESPRSAGETALNSQMSKISIRLSHLSWQKVWRQPLLIYRVLPIRVFFREPGGFR